MEVNIRLVTCVYLPTCALLILHPKDPKAKKAPYPYVTMLMPICQQQMQNCDSLGECQGVFHIRKC